MHRWGPPPRPDREPAARRDGRGRADAGAPDHAGRLPRQVRLYSDLAAALSDGQELVGPMSKDELRLAIEHPTALAGCTLEPGLTDLLLQDVRGQAGALPLLEYALLELWRQRQGNRLTIASYRDMGGVQGALEHRADAKLEEFRSRPGELEICRRIFLRLTQPGEGTEDTKRRAAFDELIAYRPSRRPSRRSSASWPTPA